ncbi:hypothetical protein N7474_002937 [Penicillium riverlandense]|uniref:uncharacterized protein n=1 Tax=Penicillium riverlandense TaxID=1903569 RepID=UPI002549B744|nr:uncharacterized protein N7474_002937 [Penicillium riverlandense]KAJ5825799.1 hypothetical protein N7474_002937 [Penicillium riverlandense]
MHLKAPYLEDTPTAKQLVVKGAPFLMRPAELQNSSMSSADFMKGVWPKLVQANINTVLGCVAWEQIEPSEGTFVFDDLDRILQDARSHGLHLILLWFGSFKNGGLQMTDTLSIFHEESAAADAQAFQRLMQHLKEVDQEHSTVIMVQVENEVGLLGDSRDRGSAANERFCSPVPSALMNVLKPMANNFPDTIQRHLRLFNENPAAENRSWEAVLGPSQQTDELFMAYHYALYLEHIASAGKAAYPIPSFTNVWQNLAGDDGDQTIDLPVVVGGGGHPGDYPSGGAVAHVLDIWRAFAPSLDLIAPDIYLNDYETLCAAYFRPGNPLFIPEQRRDEYGARRIWAAYGRFYALGASPFGIDTLGPLGENPFTKHFGLLAKVSSHVLEAQRVPGTMVGFFFDEFTIPDTSPPVIATMGGWRLVIERAFVFGKPGPGFGLVIQKGPARFLLVGEGFHVRFESLKSNACFTGILQFTEKEVVNETTGEMRSVRMLNGDETRSGKLAIMPGEDPDYGSFPICVTIPAGTRIAECEVYALEDDGA